MTTDTVARSSADEMAAPSLNKRASTPAYPFLFRLLHWLLTASVVVLILTGFSLHAGSRPDWSLLNGKVPAWFWTGRVHYWHAWASLVFAPTIFAACWLYLRRRVVIRPTHIILLGGGLLATISGYFLTCPPASAALYSASLWIHAIVGVLVIPIWFLWHMGTGLTRYVRVLVPAFHPWAKPKVGPIIAFLLLTVITSNVLMNGWPIGYPWRELAVSRIPGRMSADLSELPWEAARPLDVQLANGNGMAAGRTLLTLRALHDGSELFVRAEWADDDEDYGYWPWRKVDGGWEYMQTSSNDECLCYEDKFSLIFPVKANGDFERFGCTASCHLHSGYGWGYKGSSSLIDVWHWKAARMDPIGQVDDKYWSAVDFENKDIGRHGDPNDGGGYVKNRSEDVDRPLFLPDAPDAVYHGSMPKQRAIEYTSEAAENIAAGTMIPGVVTDAFLGDRGDVTCSSEYTDGRWTLYIQRQLATGSDYDAQFAPGGRYAFSCAAFDHSGKRHAYALPTFHLALEK